MALPVDREVNARGDQISNHCCDRGCDRGCDRLGEPVSGQERKAWPLEADVDPSAAVALPRTDRHAPAFI
jgi:hypothetical protein